MLVHLSSALGGACISCGRAGSSLCPACSPPLLEPEGGVPDGIDDVAAAWRYEGVARRLVLDLKLRGLRRAADPLASAAARIARRRPLRAEVVTWVPCRSRDRRTRGFDHAEVLARRFAGEMGLPVARLVERTGAVLRDQVGLTAPERAANMRDAFAALSAANRVALVDDLLTTGATAASVASALRSAGVRRIDLIVPCRALRE